MDADDILFAARQIAHRISFGSTLEEIREEYVDPTCEGCYHGMMDDASFRLAWEAARILADLG